MATALQRADINDSSGKYNPYYNGVIKRNPIYDPFFEKFSGRIVNKILNGTPAKADPTKNPGYNPPAKNPPSGGGSGGSGGSFTDIAPGVSVKGSSSVGWGSGGTITLPSGKTTAKAVALDDALFTSAVATDTERTVA